MNRLKSATEKLSRKYGLPDDLVPDLINELKPSWQASIDEDDFGQDDFEKLMEETDKKVKKKSEDLEKTMNSLNNWADASKDKDGDGVANNTQRGVTVIQ